MIEWTTGIGGWVTSFIVAAILVRIVVLLHKMEEKSFDGGDMDWRKIAELMFYLLLIYLFVSIVM